MLLDAAYGIIPILRLGEASSHRYLLILQRKGHWGFPKGHKEGEDESDLQAAKRELWEETGLKPTQVLTDQSFSERYQFLRADGVLVAKTVVYFPAWINPLEGKAPAVKLQLAELKDSCWCTYSEGLGRLTFEGSRQVLRHCEQWIASQISPVP